MICLENDRLKVIVSSGRGGRIDQFLDKKTGKDWVWKPQKFEGDPEAPLPLEAGFDDHWAGGWEEVFPSDAPGEVLGVKLFDHGEVWRKKWDMLQKTETGVELEVSCDTYPALVKKKIMLEDTRIIIRYELKNTSDRDLPYIFKLHPAVNIEEGDRFYLPDSEMEPIALGFSRILGVDKRTAFPVGESTSGETVTIDEVLPYDGFKREFVKINGFQYGKCSVSNLRTQTKLEFRFDHKILPFVWLFQSFGGFKDYYVAMMEPTNASHYDLALGYETGRCALLKAHSAEVFTIEICLMDI